MQLYYLAILPSRRVSERVDALKIYAATHFHSRHALRSPAHITLIPPFHADESRLAKLSQSLQLVAGSSIPFLLHLEGFGHFNQGVIYIRVRPSNPLMVLHRAISQHMAAPKQVRRHFHPHMTIAHRDLDAHNFGPAFHYFIQGSFSEYALISSVALLKLSQGQWQVDQVFPFGNRNATHGKIGSC
jgi:2'-5' RNA ligase